VRLGRVNQVARLGEQVAPAQGCQAQVGVFQPAVLACVMGSNNGTSCTSDSGCTGGGSCAPVDANTGGTALAVFATTCNLSGVDGILGKSCP